MRFCFRAVVGLLVVAWLLPVVVGQPPGPGAPSQPAPGGPPVPQPAKPQLKVKVFKLERGDPEAVLLSLNSLLEEPDADALPPMVPGGAPGAGAPKGLGVPPRGGVGTPPPGGPPSGFGGVPAPGSGALGFGGAPSGFGGMPPGGGGVTAGGGAGRPGGAIGCFLGDGGGNATPVWRATAQARTRSVVVRGSDRHLSVAADLVAILDRPATAPVPKLQVIKAFALKHATAEELAEVINALSFEDLKLATPDEHLLALIAPDDVVRSVAELVKELDVPGQGDLKLKPEPAKGSKPNETKPPR